MIIWDKLKIQDNNRAIQIQPVNVSASAAAFGSYNGLQIQTISTDPSAGLKVDGLAADKIAVTQIYAGDIQAASATFTNSISATTISANDTITAKQITATNCNVSGTATFNNAVFRNSFAVPTGSTGNFWELEATFATIDSLTTSQLSVGGRSMTQPTLTCGFVFGKKWTEDNDANVIPCGLPNGTWTLRIKDPTHVDYRMIKCTVSDHTVTWTHGEVSYGYDGTEQEFWHAAYCLDEFFNGGTTTVWILSGDYINRPNDSAWNTASHIQFNIPSGANNGGIYEKFLAAPSATSSRLSGTITSKDDNLLTVTLSPRYDRFLAIGDIYWWAHYAVDNGNYRYLQYVAQDNNEYDRGQTDMYAHFIQYDLKSPIGAQPEDCKTESANFPMREPISFTLTFDKVRGHN